MRDREALERDIEIYADIYIFIYRETYTEEEREREIFV